MVAVPIIVRYLFSGLQILFFQKNEKNLRKVLISSEGVGYKIMKDITISDLTLEDLLPHRGRMMLLEKVLEVDSKHALTLCRVEKSWPMADEKGVHPIILIELAAQTAGVCNGLDRIQTKGLDSDQMGWLVGIKKTEFFINSLPFGSEVITSAQNSYSFENLREVTCEQHMDNKLIGKSTLQLFQA